MKGINKIFIAGNVAFKPNLKQSQNGKPFVHLRVATNRFSYEEGLWKRRTDWHSVIVWGLCAELCEKFLEKGAAVAIEGSMENSQDHKTWIIAQEVHFLGLRTGTSDQPTPNLANFEEELTTSAP